ncbi:hypothetical protein [Planctomicrobium piriforme]|nr:hypothetical protein [Planctomicrobium piriforme]
MSLVEDAYRAAVDRMTPAQKFHRSLAMMVWGARGACPTDAKRIWSLFA